ncbi:MAG: DNA-processing protein DprA [Pelosinus sp.]|nr:DNA-processing protein DprA [Pelosinus sp.]
MDRIYLAALQMIPGIGNVRLKNLIDYFGSAEQAWRADRRDLFLCGCLDERVTNSLLLGREKIDVAALADKWQKAAINICTIYDKDYPSLLLNTYSPPVVLYYRGSLPSTENMLAVVGSRHASPYGKNVANLLSAELAAAGFWVVSGAARGIDTAAHLGALSCGFTVAVLGCGVDVSYPPENAKLLASIAECGAVISEHPPGTAPCPGYFPARNRIINGLSKGVAVVEAGEKSGALITVDCALEEGRDVFAVPGSIFSQGSRGTHRLIKQGAKLVECGNDILEEYKIALVKGQDSSLNLTAEEAAVYDVLPYDMPISLEEVVQYSKLVPAVVTYILLQLELRGLVAVQSGQRYTRTAREGIR